MKIIDHNVETNEIIERNATEEEISQLELDAENLLMRQQAKAAKAAEKAALLAKLGITQDEAKLLLS